jgi:hypothetical protein
MPKLSPSDEFFKCGCCEEEVKLIGCEVVILKDGCMSIVCPDCFIGYCDVVGSKPVATLKLDLSSWKLFQ